MDPQIPKIVAGGQTGADRAALEWALSHQSFVISYSLFIIAYPSDRAGLL
jgi:hypothetical protein